MKKCDIGMVGMAVMGENLALNMGRHGYSVAVFDIRDGVTDNFVNEKGAQGRFFSAHSLSDFVEHLSSPKKIMIMIKAGDPVDEVLSNLLPLLNDGDIVIDGGNSLYKDTIRRIGIAGKSGILFVGCGVSGGEEGALNGPSLMPGGRIEAWEHIKDILQTISAKTPDGSPCCEWVGEGGAGHFVKMVHNGIEYGDMQLICEVYQIMRDCLAMTEDEIQEVFCRWNKGVLESYLIKITSEITGYREKGSNSYLLNNILDAAGQKGTGKWACIEALEEGVPLTLIGEAVYARCLSAQKEERIEASEKLTYKSPGFTGNREIFLTEFENALYAAKIVSYAQGFRLMRQASENYGWNLDYGNVSLLWRGGCIIRSAFLSKIYEAYKDNKELSNLLLAPYFSKALMNAQDGWRHVCAVAMTAGIPVPALSSALSYYDGVRCARLPANLLQAQRDYFGAHTYERTDMPRGRFFHTEWTDSEKTNI